ncbi:MAG: hypothetical protein M9894_34620 [Planctomycetes bacterium]|nr:hypothetical protein [Planctomycetota bacterium]
MSTPSTPNETPGRRAARSALAQADLARRLGRLPLPPEAIPRLVRFVEDEVHAALEARAAEGFTAAEVEAAGGDAALLEALERRRAERERLAGLRRAGLDRLDRAELEQVLEQARRG